MNAKKYLNLPMNKYYFKKANCVEEAKEIIDEEKITGMTRSQLAAEIYFHAFVYYNFHYLPKFVQNTDFAKRIYESTANGIDLEDNGDKLFRRFCYRLVWVV